MKEKIEDFVNSDVYSQFPNLEKPTILYRSGEHTIYWLGIDESTSFRCNVYLICDGDVALIVDPGGVNSFSQVFDRVSQIIDPKEITGLILCHQDPDVASSMVEWLRFNPDVEILSTPRTQVLLPHYGNDQYLFKDVEKYSTITLPSGGNLSFILAPFLHFAGAFVVYDEMSGFLFSGDVWAALDIDWQLIVSDFDAHKTKMDLFHKDYMPSNIATRGFANSISGIQIEAILPQHGSIISSDNVPKAIDYLTELECGTDLIYPTVNLQKFGLKLPNDLTSLSAEESEEIVAQYKSDEIEPSLDENSNENSRLRQVLSQSARLALLRESALKELRMAEEALTQSNLVIEIVKNLQRGFIEHVDIYHMYDDLLKEILILTHSQYGFVAETKRDPDDTQYLLIYALCNLSWSQEEDREHKEHPKGFEFRNLDSLPGRVVTSGKPIIDNNLNEQIDCVGLPEGHPPADSFLGVPIFYGEELIGEIALINKKGGFRKDLIEYLHPIMVACGQIIIARRNREARIAAEKKLKELATLDGLTGIPNRRYFDEYLELEWKRAFRSKNPISLIMIDIDHFKLYNDNYGHPAGDACLKEVALVIRGALSRPADIAARYGGEEFMCILPNTSLEGAMVVAKSIQASLKRASIRHEHSPVSQNVTLSMGIATDIPSSESAWNDLINKADVRLYRAKSTGRDTIVST